jgi:hypothetical protein
MQYDLLNPSTIEEYVIQFSIGFLFLILVDKTITPTKARWFCLHVFINAVVCYFAWPDTKLCLTDPKKCFRHDEKISNNIPWMIATVGHMYHMIAFGKLRSADYFHHIIMVPVGSLVGLYFSKNPGFNFAIFGLTGLPGGLDYMLLTLVKLDYIDWLVEKKLNVIIQKWFRMPIILLGTGIFYTEFLDGHLPYGSLIGVSLTAWNAIYYMDDTLYNYYTKHCRIQLNGNEEIVV